MKEDIPPRRFVLRSALALGCGLWLPALSGCDSKNGAASSGGTAGSAGSAAPAAGKKMPKASVQYQPQPKGEQKCSQCRHFVAESKTCQLVEGEISPEGWCVQWARKV